MGLTFHGQLLAPSPDEPVDCAIGIPVCTGPEDESIEQVGDTGHSPLPLPGPDGGTDGIVSLEKPFGPFCEEERFNVIQ
jgi:hypothetical protein